MPVSSRRPAASTCQVVAAEMAKTAWTGLPTGRTMADQANRVQPSNQGGPSFFQHAFVCRDVPMPPQDVIPAAPSPRPFMTASWTELLMLSFEVPPDAIARIAPPGTLPDLHAGVAYASIVGFRFQDSRIWGVPIPGHKQFDEVNLRYYVRRNIGGVVRRGVVFAQEIVPRRAVAAVANWLYNESYVVRPVRHEIRMTGRKFSAGDQLEYRWQSVATTGRPWHRIGARAKAPSALPAPGSVEEFIVEHYWGYGRYRDGSTVEYFVAHDPWRVAPANDVVWTSEIAAEFDSPLAEFLAAPPSNALLADGSSVQVFSGRRLDTTEPSASA